MEKADKGGHVSPQSKGAASVPQDDQSGEDMPDMAPVCIRSDLPQLQGHVENRVLADKDLTWREYLSMFGVQLNSTEYHMKGTGGRELNLDSKIGDYIDAFKRKHKVHPVSIERIRKREGQQVKDTSPPVIPPKTAEKRRGSPKKRKVRGEYKKRKIDNLQSVPKNISPSKTTRQSESIESSKEKQVPPPTLPVQTASTGTQIRSTPKNSVEPSEVVSASPVASTSEAKSDSKPSNSETLPDAQEIQVQIKSEQTDSDSIREQHALNSSTINEATFAVPRPKINRHRTVIPEIERPDFNPGALDYDSSDDESIIIRNPRKATPLVNMKPSVVHFLTNKVSNKDMLKVRDELMKLKDNDDYFKMTSLTPLAAGLLEQMLCRKVPKQN